MEFLDQAGFKVAKWDDLANTQEISVLRPSKTHLGLVPNAKGTNLKILKIPCHYRNG
jgi:hypothetical protein